MHPPTITALAIFNAGGAVKYLQTIALNAGVVTDITTTLTAAQIPYSIRLFDEDAVTANLWNDITADVTIGYILAGGVWHIYIYSVDALAGVLLKILY